ncbi:hypothetical protein EPN42_04075 [bacterium]|nr:MAG: hypothetical protein EPN42_04075 [bacterium]
MKLFVGVDGGQTATQAVVGDEHGAVLGRGESGPANHVDEPGAEERLRSAVEEAVRGALHSAGLASTTLLAGAHVALTGEIEERRTAAVESVVHAERLTVGHDAPAAWMGAFAGAPGVAVIAGTGSVAFGRNAQGEEVRVGGWGYLFGDRGSAFWLAAEAIRRALDVLDRGRETPLGEAARRHFGVARLPEVPAAFYRRSISRSDLAGFARVIAAMAAQGDVAAAGLVEEAGRALAELALVALDRLALRRGGVVLVGGAAGDPLLRRVTAHELVLRGATMREPLAEPVVGALWLAGAEQGGRHA